LLWQLPASSAAIVAAAAITGRRLASGYNRADSRAITNLSAVITGDEVAICTSCRAEYVQTSVHARLAGSWKNSL